MKIYCNDKSARGVIKDIIMKAQLYFYLTLYMLETHFDTF